MTFGIIYVIIMLNLYNIILINQKMKLIKILFVFTAIICLNLSSFAQKKWSLEECINYAIENNITVKRQELTANSADKSYFQSYMEMLPSINANGNHYLNSGKAINYETYEYTNQNFQGGSVSLNSELILFSGLQNLNKIKKSKYDLMAQLETVEKVKNDITLNVSTAYLQILLNKELRDNAKHQLEITMEQIKKTKRLVEIGNAAKGDLLQIEAQAALEKASLIDTENNLKLSYLTLSQLLNLDSSENFEIINPEIKDITISDELTSVGDVFGKAVEILPEVKSAEYHLKSAEKNLSISKGALSPTISVGYQYNSRYNALSNKLDSMSFGVSSSPTGITAGGENIFNYSSMPHYADSYSNLDQISDNASQAIFVSLRIPIFNKWRTKNSIEQAKINLSDSKLNLDLQKQHLYQSIQQASTQAAAALEKYIANAEAVKSIEEAFRYTEQKYQVGLVDILEYKIAKNNLNKTKSDLSQAKYEYIFRTKILEFYKGEQITL